MPAIPIFHLVLPLLERVLGSPLAFEGSGSPPTFGLDLKHAPEGIFEAEPEDLKKVVDLVRIAVKN